LKQNHSFTIESIGQSDIGLMRNNNEDVFRELSKEQFFILADGMGGHNAGEVAALKAVDYMCSAIQSLLIKTSKEIPLQQMQSHLSALIENTNLWIHHLGVSNPKFYGMGTTLCSVLFIKNFIIYSHVGDSRIYRLREGKLQQLTNDHTLFSQKMSETFTNQSDDRVLSKMKVLARAIGTSIAVVPEVSADLAKPSDLYMMCSDGLTDIVSNDEIERLMNKTNNLQKAGQFLIQAAKDGGGHDNITLILMRTHS